MAIVTKKREDDTYSKLLGMAGQPSATPTRRVGADTPIGSAAAGPKGGQTAEEFTSTTQASPGSVFKRQVEGAKRSGIGGITALAERPLQREFGQEIARLGQEGIAYKKASAKAREEEPQFQYKEGDKDLTKDIVDKLASGDEEEIAKAQTVLGRGFIPTTAFTTRDIKEFTPQAALRGGSIESLLRQEAKGPYSTGMAGLDALLFKQQGGAKELAQKGQTLRGAGQLAANVLQGKGEGVLDKGIKEALENVGVTGNLTKEQEELNKQFVEQQKADLEAAIRSGLVSREEAYTKAPQGGKSKLTLAQEALQKKIDESRTKELREAERIVKDTKESLEMDAFSKSLARMFGGKVPDLFQSFAYYNDPVLRQLVQSNPQYQTDIAKAREVTRRLPSSLSTYVSNPLAPKLGLQNVMSADEAGQYNRLQELLQGQQIKQQTITAPQAQLDRSRLQEKINKIITESGYY
jgi:hypothetical protein